MVFAAVLGTEPEEWRRIFPVLPLGSVEKSPVPLLRGDSAAAAVWDVAKAPAEVLSCLLLAAALP